MIWVAVIIGACILVSTKWGHKSLQTLVGLFLFFTWFWGVYLAPGWWKLGLLLALPPYYWVVIKVVQLLGWS